MKAIQIMLLKITLNQKRIYIPTYYNNNNVLNKHLRTIITTNLI